MQNNNLQDIYNFRPISAVLGSAGQPERDQFAAIQSAGYQVVINLAMPDSTRAIPEEASLVREQGLEYVYIPVVWVEPQPSDLAAFFRAMDERQDKKIFVHCAMNFRASAFVFLYRVMRQGVPLETARQDMLEIWEPNDIWQRFINGALAHSAGSSKD
ncbi:MAG: protein tyrosine phosphatase family protein [Anaerolineaceae bacterium]|nr:protein tyrosine phosphatase family protein [Anaerolineaceae bacterium]